MDIGNPTVTEVPVINIPVTVVVAEPHIACNKSNDVFEIFNMIGSVIIAAAMFMAAFLTGWCRWSSGNCLYIAIENIRGGLKKEYIYYTYKIKF
jgi:hypothetical protein